MKIDEGCINHNAMMLIKDMDFWGSLDTEQENLNQYRIIMLGYIAGVTDMTNVLKQVLKA